MNKIVFGHDQPVTHRMMLSDMMLPFIITRKLVKQSIASFISVAPICNKSYHNVAELNKKQKQWRRSETLISYNITETWICLLTMLAGYVLLCLSYLPVAEWPSPPGWRRWRCCSLGCHKHIWSTSGSPLCPSLTQTHILCWSEECTTYSLYLHYYQHAKGLSQPARSNCFTSSI